MGSPPKNERPEKSFCPRRSLPSGDHSAQKGADRRYELPWAKRFHHKWGNCRRESAASQSTNFELGNYFKFQFQIDGQYQYFNAAGINDAPKKSWKLDGISAYNGYDGIMLEGKIDENAQSFAIKLWNRAAGDGGKYNPIIVVEIGILSQQYKISNGVCSILFN